MTLPTIHLNGTSASSLRESYEAAYRAVNEAYDALRQSAPNGRDYYPQGPDAYGRAEKEHTARLQKLHDVLNELETLVAHCDEHDDGRGQ